jgi:hypothetical protein
VFYKRRKRGNHRLIGYSDSDYAGDVDDRKSTSGMLYCLGESPITWNSGKQKVVALSSCEAEYSSCLWCMSGSLAGSVAEGFEWRKAWSTNSQGR